MIQTSDVGQTEGQTQGYITQVPVDFRQLWSQLNFERPPHYNLQSWSVPVRGLMMQLLQIQGEGTAGKKNHEAQKPHHSPK